MAEYHRCPGCTTIFTSDDISSEIVTENDHPARNTPGYLDGIMKRVSFVAAGLYLDFGCGDQSLIKFIESNSEAIVIGVDLDTSVQLKDFSNEYLDGAFMIEVIEHLSNPIRTVKDILQKLKPGAWLYIQSTFADSISDHTTHPYVNPKIGHRVMLSQQALASIPDVTQEWVNPHVVILRKK